MENPTHPFTLLRNCHDGVNKRYEIGAIQAKRLLQRFLNVIHRWVDDKGWFHIGLSGQEVYLNGERMQADFEQSPSVQWFMVLARERQIQSLAFHRRVEMSDLGHFFQTFQLAPNHFRNAQTFQELLTSHNIRRIEVNKPYRKAGEAIQKNEIQTPQVVRWRDRQMLLFLPQAEVDALTRVLETSIRAKQFDKYQSIAGMIRSDFKAPDRLDRELAYSSYYIVMLVATVAKLDTLVFTHLKLMSKDFDETMDEAIFSIHLDSLQLVLQHAKSRRAFKPLLYGLDLLGHLHQQLPEGWLPPVVAAAQALLDPATVGALVQLRKPREAVEAVRRVVSRHSALFHPLITQAAGQFSDPQMVEYAAALLQGQLAFEQAADPAPEAGSSDQNAEEEALFQALVGFLEKQEDKRFWGIVDHILDDLKSGDREQRQIAVNGLSVAIQALLQTDDNRALGLLLAKLPRYFAFVNTTELSLMMLRNLESILAHAWGSRRFEMLITALGLLAGQGRNLSGVTESDIEAGIQRLNSPGFVDWFFGTLSHWDHLPFVALLEDVTPPLLPLLTEALKRPLDPAIHENIFDLFENLNASAADALGDSLSSLPIHELSPKLFNTLVETLGQQSEDILFSWIKRVLPSSRQPRRQDLLKILFKLDSMEACSYGSKILDKASGSKLENMLRWVHNSGNSNYLKTIIQRLQSEFLRESEGVVLMNALEKWPQPEVTQYLVDLVADKNVYNKPDNFLRPLAVRILSRRDGGAHLKFLAKYKRDRNPQVKEAIKALL